ncbi:hypothetical protein Q7P37_006779 [Cladosporium fusiforme]
MAEQHGDHKTFRAGRPWTHEEAVCVYMLYTEYHASNYERASIFNEVFGGRPSETQIYAAGQASKATIGNVPPRSPKSVENAYYSKYRRCSPLAKAGEDSMRTHMRTRIADVVAQRDGRDIYRASAPAMSLQQLTPPATPSTQAYGDTELARSPVEKMRPTKILYIPSTIEDLIDDDEYSPPSKRKRESSQSRRVRYSRPRPTSPVVLIPRIQDDTAQPGMDEPAIPLDLKTPRRISTTSDSGKGARLSRRPAEKMIYSRMGNTPTSLPAHRYLSAPPSDADYVDVPEEKGHPWIPALLFRYWDNGSRGSNSHIGFKSGRTALARAPPRRAPLCKDLEWTDVLEHLNPNSSLESPQPSPFISTSSRLLWTIQQGLRKLGTAGHISVIDPSFLDARAVYYVPPFHKQLHRHFAFDRGAQYWTGLSEHLVWNEVPESSMVMTFTLSQLCDFADSDPDVKRILRLNMVKSDSKLDRTIRAFKQDKVKVTNQKAAAIARIVMFFGFSHATASNVLSRIVYEITQGWALFPEDNVTESAWQDKALWFTHTLCRRSDAPVTLARQAEICHAFLDGLQWSRGERGNLNTQYEPEKVLLMQKRAAKIGLADPVKIVANDLNAAARSIQDYDTDQRRRLDSLWRRPLAVEGRAEEDEGEEDSHIQSEQEGMTEPEDRNEVPEPDLADYGDEQDGVSPFDDPRLERRRQILMCTDEAF